MRLLSSRPVRPVEKELGNVHVGDSPLVAGFFILLAAASLLAYSFGLVEYADQFPGLGQPGVVKEHLFLLLGATLLASVLHVIGSVAVRKRAPRVTVVIGVAMAALVNILVEPKNSLVKQYMALFEMENVELDIRHDALEAIADKALERKTGARGLRSIIENVLLDTMYSIPSRDDVAKVVIDVSVIQGESEPILVYETEQPKKAASDE